MCCCLEKPGRVHHAPSLLQSATPHAISSNPSSTHSMGKGLSPRHQSTKSSYHIRPSYMPCSAPVPKPPGPQTHVGNRPSHHPPRPSAKSRPTPNLRSEVQPRSQYHLGTQSADNALRTLRPYLQMQLYTQRLVGKGKARAVKVRLM